MHELLASFIKSFFLCGHNHFKQLQPSGIYVATREVVRGGCDCHSGALEAALGGNETGHATYTSSENEGHLLEARVTAGPCVVAGGPQTASCNSRAPFSQVQMGQHPLRFQIKLLQMRRPRTEAQTQIRWGQARRPPPGPGWGPHLRSKQRKTRPARTLYALPVYRTHLAINTWKEV